MEYKISNGLIVGAASGLYDVESFDGAEIIKCKPRGVFRKMELIPCVGDRVNITNDNVIAEILPRKNFIVRPPLANLDTLFFVVSSCQPAPNYMLLDKFIAVACYKGIKPVIILTKLDLESADEVMQTYQKTDIKVICADYNDTNTKNIIISLMEGRICAFTGNSGVGKSTLLNFLGDFYIETNEISKKLGRGRHTTRNVSLFKMQNGGYVADTPGFSTFDTNRYDIIKKGELASCFTEFEKFTEKCKFRDCSHTSEIGCAVIDAVKNGDVSKSRHNSYCAMYNEAKQIKDWQL